MSSKELPLEEGWSLIDEVDYGFNTCDGRAGFPDARMEIQQNGDKFRLVYTRGEGFITYAELAGKPKKTFSDIDKLGHAAFMEIMAGSDGYGPSLIKVAQELGTQALEAFEVFEAGEDTFNRKMRAGALQ